MSNTLVSHLAKKSHKINDASSRHAHRTPSTEHARDWGRQRCSTRRCPFVASSGSPRVDPLVQRTCALSANKKCFVHIICYSVTRFTAHLYDYLSVFVVFTAGMSGWYHFLSPGIIQSKGSERYRRIRTAWVPWTEHWNRVGRGYRGEVGTWRGKKWCNDEEGG